MEMEKADQLFTQPIPAVFEKDKDGLAVPRLVTGSEWTKEKNALVTYKLDGIGTKIVPAAEAGKVVILKKMYTQEGKIFYGDITEGSTDPHDIAIVEAFHDNPNRRVGYYITYGKDIKGNPQNADFNNMILLSPIDGKLLVGEHVHAFKRGTHHTVEEFFESVRKELAEGDVMGVVFHFEHPSMVTHKLAQVTRQDFGLPWPLPDAHKDDPPNTNLLVYRGKNDHGWPGGDYV